MAETDFVDKDLQNREALRRRTVIQEPIGIVSEGEELYRPVSDLNLTRMAKHRKELESQVADSAHELDRLRMRQEELERERRELEDLRKKQEDYERGRRELSDRLHHSLIRMEKEQLRSERLTELLVNTTAEFKGVLGQIEGMEDEYWPDDQVRDELTKALAVIEEGRVQFNKGITKIEAAMAADRANDPHGESLINRGGRDAATRPGFGYWFKVGLAASLPLIVALLALSLVFVYLYFHSRGLL